MEGSTENTRIACVGDSITFGHGIKERKRHCYPSQLQNLLGEKYEVGNFGTNHATVFRNGGKPYWKMLSFQNAKTFRPNIVIMIFGANCSNKRNWKNQENYETDVLSLVQEFQNLSTRPQTILCLPPPAFQNKFGVRPLVLENEIIPKLELLMDQNNITTIDLHSPLKNDMVLFPDAVHPDRIGASKIAAIVYNHLKKYPLKNTSFGM